MIIILITESVHQNIQVGCTFAIAQVWKSTKVSADIALALIQKRDMEYNMCDGCKMDELKERAQIFGVKVKQRKKSEYVKTLVFEKCQDLSLWTFLRFESSN